MIQDWEPVVWKKEESNSNKYQGETAVREMDYSIQKAIQQARMACKMSQKELATKLQVKVNVIIEYENGKAVPNNLFISKMETILNTKLPRATKKKFDE